MLRTHDLWLQTGLHFVCKPCVLCRCNHRSRRGMPWGRYVNDDDLNVGIRLRESAVYRGGDEAAIVIVADQDALAQGLDLVVVSSSVQSLRVNSFPCELRLFGDGRETGPAQDYDASKHQAGQQAVRCPGWTRPRLSKSKQG